MFFRNLTIRTKLLLIALMPLAALFYFVALTVSAEIARKNRIQKVHSEVLVAEQLSNAVHELQQERGYSLSFLISEGSEERSELLMQREKTDKALFSLTRTLKEQGQSLPPSLGALSVAREEVNALKVNTDEIRSRFTGMIRPMLDEISKMVALSQDPDIRNMLETHTFLIYGKESFGGLRATLKQAILENGFRENNYAQFVAFRSVYESNLERFRKSATGELKAQSDKKIASQAVHQVHAIMDSAYRQPNFTRFPFSANDWWINGVAYLNTLKEIEDHSTLEISRTAERKLAHTSASLTRNIIIALVVVMLISLLLVYTVRSVVASLREIKNAAERITQGDVDFSLAPKTRDEIGNLARSFNQLIQVTKEYGKVAETIGQGDYSPTVKVRSALDTLGQSLRNMRDNLKSLSEENEIRTRLLVGNSEVNDTMRGEKSAAELANGVIARITTYLNAQVGVLYLAENNHLTLAGSYAYHQRKGNSNQIAFGEGLAGQAALENKPIVFSQVPGEYMSIQSGLGNAAPKNILIYPFSYDGKLKGVIELGSAREFSDLDRQFLDMVSENIAIAFTVSQSRDQMKELLEETQRQAEELEVQQEELRQINEELQEKTGMLERSEAELKAQQEELQQTNEELEEKANLLEEQKEKLEITKMEVENKARELEVTSKYKSEFLANMSHELRTPLNSILILSQLLSENKQGSLTGKDVEFAKNIHSSGSDLLQLINEILDLSKVESGKIELEIQPVQIGSIVDNMQLMFREVANSKKIRFGIHTEKPEFLEGFSTDKQRLEQILRNLLSNAFKFTEKGGEVRLDIGLVPPALSISNARLRRQPAVVAFRIRDTGIGIPESKQKIIFNAFQQADGSTKRKYGGTGLGLSISRELAHALGGEIHLSSVVGEGSIFTLYLPVKFDLDIVEPLEKGINLKEAPPALPPAVEEPVPDDTAQPSVADDRHNLRENDRTILIIEDDVAFAKILLELSRERGFKGILAHQGNTGLSLARYYRPDAIILDLMLPVMDGTDVLKQLKNDPQLRHIPVQIISGADKRKESLEQGALHFMKKPLQVEDVQSILDRMQQFINKKMKKLLVVEDNQQQNVAIRELIGNNDVKSFAAYTAKEAIEMLNSDQYDCIIMDLGLPDMSGFDLLEKIKENEVLNKIPVIVYTGRDLTREEAGKLNKLADTVVLKTSSSKERLLDETTLFLHRVESRLPKEKQQIIRKLHRTDEILKNKKVLVVDDDVRNTYSLTNVLEEEGMEYVTAENGKAALEVLEQQEDIDIILMDVMMPVMDGYEATREIRKSPKFGKMPIIGLTAKAMKGDREKCLEAGMSDYVPKPVNIEQLLSLMRVWLYQ